MGNATEEVRHVGQVADAAKYLCRMIRDWLPVEGQTPTFSDAANGYSTVFLAARRLEDILNPAHIPFGGQVEVTESNLTVTEPEMSIDALRKAQASGTKVVHHRRQFAVRLSATYGMEVSALMSVLWTAFDGVLAHYGWQAICAGAQWFNSVDTPRELPATIVDKMETAANRLGEIVNALARAAPAPESVTATTPPVGGPTPALPQADTDSWQRLLADFRQGNVKHGDALLRIVLVGGDAAHAINSHPHWRDPWGEWRWAGGIAASVIVQDAQAPASPITFLPMVAGEAATPTLQMLKELPAEQLPPAFYFWALAHRAGRLLGGADRTALGVIEGSFEPAPLWCLFLWRRLAGYAGRFIEEAGPHRFIRNVFAASAAAIEMMPQAPAGTTPASGQAATTAELAALRQAVNGLGEKVAALPNEVVQAKAAQAKTRRGWTQPSVNEEIRKLKKTHKLAFEKWKKRFKAGDAAVTEEARSVFGRNVIAGKLGCSEGLVSTSTAWREISKALGLSDRTPNRRPGKSDMVMASEQKSEASSEKDNPEYLAEKKEALIRLRKRQGDLVGYVESKPKAAAAGGMPPEALRKATETIILDLESDFIKPDVAEQQMAQYGVQVQDACRRKYGQTP